METFRPPPNQRKSSDSLHGSSNNEIKLPVSQLRFPENKWEADLVEAAFSKEFERLSLDEHEKILFDIHGIACTSEEDVKIEEKLQQLQSELAMLPTESKVALELAQQQNHDYVQDRAFQIWFLRSCRMDAKEAAEVLALHFQVKRELFGDGDVLGRDIQISDLGEGELRLLKSGILQVLPARDAAGRAVVWCGINLTEKKPFEISTRLFMYYVMATFQNVEMHSNGTVLVLYNYGEYSHSHNLGEVMSRFYRAIPLRLLGVHYCFNGDALPFAAGVRLSLQPDEQFRFKTHQGTPEQVEFALQTYGIPTHHIPYQKDGTLALGWHQKWLDAQRKREANNSGGNTILVPQLSDVLFGRGKFTREHPGNLRLVNFCEKHLTDYDKANKRGKTEISTQLVTAVKESQGRFLKWSTSDGWVQVDDKGAREKISHFFRHLRSKTFDASSTDSATTGKRHLDQLL